VNATLREIVHDFVAAMQAVDARQPVASRGRRGGGGVFRPGIGPHPEDAVVRMCLDEMAVTTPAKYGPHQRGVPYSGVGRSKCDVCLGIAPNWEWAIEAKLLRFLGDNGLPNDNMLTHILSPYPRDCSALTDCTKLVNAALAKRTAVLIFGYEHPGWDLQPAVEAFETLAAKRVRFSERIVERTGTLVHPVHSSATVFGWEVTSL
jgi:hypothetical protein